MILLSFTFDRERKQTLRIKNVRQGRTVTLSRRLPRSCNTLHEEQAIGPLVARLGSHKNKFFKMQMKEKTFFN